MYMCMILFMILYIIVFSLLGSIPPELGNLTSLTRLYLYNNILSGERNFCG